MRILFDRKSIPIPVTLNDCYLLYQMGYDIEINDGRISNIVKKKEVINTMKPYEALVDAIIAQACDDYRNALNELSQDPLSVEAYDTKSEVEHFFRSDWFTTLTDIDPKYLLKKLRKQIKGGN